MKRIGILRGTENTFPEALIAFINSAYDGTDVHAEFVSLDSVSLDGEPVYDVILDRISPEVPFYRSYLKWAALRGTYVVNNPFWWGADDKFVGHVIARRLGVAAPRTVMLPHKQPPPNTQPTSFRNLRFPIDWPTVFEHVGFPAFLKPHESGNRRGVTKVRNPQEFFAAYDASGTTCMMLQGSIEFEDYFRCYCIGRSEVHLMRYNPAMPHEQRYSAVSRGPIPTGLRHRLEHDVRALCTALGYDVNCVEFAVRGGIPYAVDVINPVPDADRHSVGEANFDWVVRTTAACLVGKTEEKHSPQYEAQRMLGAQAPAQKLKVVAKPLQVTAKPAMPRPSAGVPRPAKPPESAKPAPKPAKPEAKPAKAAPASPKAAKPKLSPKPSRPEPISKPATRTPPPQREDVRAAKMKVKATKPVAKPPKQPAKPATGLKARPVVPRRIQTAAKPAAGRAQPAKAAVKPAKPTPKTAPGRAKPPAKKTVAPPRQVAKKATISKRVGAKPIGRKATTPVAKAKAATPEPKRPPAKPPTRAKRSRSSAAERR